MNGNITITEEYTLPSKGLLYGKPFDPHVKLRSMTVAEEMKRLSPSETPYKTMSEIIEACLLTPLPVSVYDLCFGDYVYLLHKLRTTTYGSDYTLQWVCPHCGKIEKSVINLDDLKVLSYEDDLKEMMTVTLPRTGKVVGLRFQTPRDLDKIATRSKELKKQFPEMDNPALLLTLESFIDTIDGAPVNKVFIGEELKKLPALDYNAIAQKAVKLNEKVGIDTIITVKCGDCNNDVKSTFRYTDEFFRPTIN